MNQRTIPIEWLPTIPRRYATTVIDGLLVLAVFIIPTMVFSETELSRVTRIAAALLAALVYDPIFTGRFVTLGQLVTSVRVRRIDNGRKIGVPRAFGRILLKGFLGVLSFLILPFTPGRRALHDLATGSIVILASHETDFVRWTVNPTSADLVDVSAGSTS